MLSKSLQLSSLSIVRYGSSFVLGLMLCTASAPVLAHVGHNSEFAGGDATKIMQPIEVDANKAAALGIKTEAVTPTPDGGILKVPSTSLVDANGQKLVYIQEGATYKPISVQIGSDSGDVVEIKEGNLVSGNQIVTQGATLLYSEALRGKPQASPGKSVPEAQASPGKSVPEAKPTQTSSPLVPIAATGVVLVGVLAIFGLKGKRKSIFK
ncbi:MAG: hypothetical protein U7123_20105 [Potamolinea sp.]